MHAPSSTASPAAHLEVIRAVLHGYAIAFWWAAGFFALGAVITFVMLESGVPELEGDLVPLI